jgi:sister chromatid cohesion protein PDS5
MTDDFEFQTDGRLQFNQSLLQKSISTSALVARLKELQAELSKMDQQTVVKESLGAVKKELFTLTSHKDRYVKILVACCISDVLRLYAPDAPFNNSQLKAIFQLFFKQLHNIEDPSNVYFSNYFYLLDSMSTIKSVVLLADLNQDALIIEVFKDFFDIVNPKMTQTVQVCLRDILHQLIEEMSYLPQQVVDTIISHFSVKKQKSNPASFRLACDLCTLMEDKFQRYVCQYFSDSIIASSKDLEDDMNLNEFKKSHSLILQIFEHVPALLLNVVPQLEEELKVENMTIRQIASTTLGEMFSKRGVRWMETYPSVWKGWCERRHDKAVIIRANWTEYCALILQNHPEMVKHVEDLFVSKLVDPDEKVRVAAINSIEHVIHDHPELFKQTSIKALSERCKDKKSNVRLAAIEALGQLFCNVMKSATESSDIHADAYNWIPGVVLEVAYLDDPESTILMEKVFLEYLVPPNPDHQLRTMRLLQVISHLNDRQMNVFKSIINRQSATIQTFHIFIEQSIKYNAGVMDQNEEEITTVLHQIITFMCQKLPDTKKSETQMLKFAQMNEARLYKLFRSIMDPTSDFKTVLKYNKEIASRLGKQTALMDILNIFIRRISLYLINKDTVEVLLSLVQKGSKSVDTTTKEIASLSEQLMKDISKLFPALYKTQLEKLTDIIREDSNEDYGLIN